MTKLITAAVLTVMSCGVAAEPWIGMMDASLHEDLRTLTEYGVVDATTVSYPVPWKGIKGQLKRLDVSTLPDAARQAAVRLRHYANQQRAFEQMTRVYGATSPSRFTGLDRQQGESARASHLIRVTAGGFSGQLQGNWSAGGDTYLDGSYAAYDFGAVTLRAGAIDQFWGPGHASSLILSTNARPVPTVGLFRSRATQSDSKWLSWLGPWYASAEVGQLESDRVVPDTRLWRTRFSFKPLSGLSIGFSWAAMWGGEGQPGSWSDFVDVITFKKECINDLATCDEELNTTKGNHIAGFDIKYTFMLADRPVSLYAQRIGEDAVDGYRITDNANLVGISTYAGPVKFFAEHSDTNIACNGDGSTTTDCYYEHGTYKSGYRYYQRAIGSTWDSDAKQLTIGARWHAEDGKSAYAALTRFELNPDGTRPSPVLEGRQSEDGYFLTGYYQQAFNAFLVRVGGTVVQSDSGETDNTDATGYVDIKYYW